jgi:hypothetical protein
VNPLLAEFVGDLPGGCATYCLPCAAFLGVASGKTDGAKLQPYYDQVDWGFAQQQSPLTLGALMSWRPRPLLAPHENSNTVCETCDKGAPDDDDDDDDNEALVLLLCSYCNLSYHNDDDCLGKDGGKAIPKHAAQNEDYEWSCPRCWKDAVKKAQYHRSTAGATVASVGKKKKKAAKKPATKKPKNAAP